MYLEVVKRKVLSVKCFGSVVTVIGDIYHFINLTCRSMTCLIDLIYTDFKIDGSTQKQKYPYKMAPRGEEENGAIKLEDKTSSANFNGHFRNLNWRYLPYMRPT